MENVEKVSLKGLIFTWSLRLDLDLYKRGLRHVLELKNGSRLYTKIEAYFDSKWAQ